MKKVIKRKSEEIPEEKNDKANFNNIDYKQKGTPTFDNLKHNIYRYINKNIPKDIESFEQDGYYCIGLKLAGYGNYSYPECYKNNVIYSYSSIKNQVDFKGYLEKIK